MSDYYYFAERFLSGKTPEDKRRYDFSSRSIIEKIPVSDNRTLMNILADLPPFWSVRPSLLEETMRWYKAMRPYAIEWIIKSKSVGDIRVKFMHKRNRSVDPIKTHEEVTNNMMIVKHEVRSMFDISEHLDTVLLELIFSRKYEEPETLGFHRRFGDGFVQIHGRYPCRDDRATVYHLEGNGTKRFFTFYRNEDWGSKDMILSEFCIGDTTISTNEMDK